MKRAQTSINNSNRVSHNPPVSVESPHRLHVWDSQCEHNAEERSMFYCANIKWRVVHSSVLIGRVKANAATYKHAIEQKTHSSAHTNTRPSYTISSAFSSKLFQQSGSPLVRHFWRFKWESRFLQVLPKWMADSEPSAVHRVAPCFNHVHPSFIPSFFDLGRKPLCHVPLLSLWSRASPGGWRWVLKAKRAQSKKNTHGKLLLRTTPAVSLYEQLFLCWWVKMFWLWGYQSESGIKTKHMLGLL